MLLRQLLFFVGAVLVTIGFALYSPWPAYALAPAILAPFSIMLIIGIGIASVLVPEGRARDSVQTVTILLSGVFAGSLILFTIFKAG